MNLTIAAANLQDAQIALELSQKRTRVAEIYLKECEEDLFFLITDKKYLFGSIITAYNMNYRILQVGIEVDYLSDSIKYITYVKAIRVKKGTIKTIASKHDGIAYADKIYTSKIDKVIT